MKRALTINIFFAAIIGLTTVGCRSKMDIKTKSGGPKPAALPDEAGDASDAADEPETVVETGIPAIPLEKKSAVFIEGTKKYFQSRDTIVIRIKKEVIEGSDSFSVLNVTKSGADESKAVVLVDHDVNELGLRSISRYSLAEKDGDDLLIKFYPGTQNWQGKFFYDSTKPNLLKIIAHDEDNPRFAMVEVYLRDFDTFGLSMLSFESNVQVAALAGAGGYQFQGWLNNFGPPAVQAEDGTILVNGFFNLINPL